ncbi:MAG: T9SS type A sorting domain-containing protein [Ignavibacteriaceae bacterium]|nr:T9SS type A sorting domain-containing protein [Ignavibacteriaceae bacterium]
MKRYVFLFTALCSFTLTFMFFSNESSSIKTMADFIQFNIERKISKQNIKYDQPDEAIKWYYEQRAYPLGYIPENWRDEAYEHIRLNNISESNSPAALNWTQLGPANIGGRIRSIAIHPSNPNIVYVGGVAGGVWKTTDGGSNWSALTDFMENLAVCALVMDPANPNILYAGTGEGFFNLDAIQGAGIFKTTDAGTTWSRLSSTNNSDFYYVNDLAIDNTNGAIYAATRKGLFRSNNGGTSFSTVLSSGGSDVHCTDIEIAYTSPATIYACFGLFNQSTVYRSIDGGASFQANLSQSGMGRIELAVSNSNPLVAYVSMLDLNTYGVGIMGITTDGGGSWYSITVPGPSYSGASNYAGTQAWYDNILSVDPDNPAVLYAGGIDFWKSNNNGNSWTQKTNWYVQSGAPQYVHADHHAIQFAPSNSNIMYLGTDGGMFKSTNKGENWSAINNGLYITQFYYGAVAPNGTKYYGGTQDNGTLATNGSTSWFEILGGDGGATEVDFVNPNNIYMEYVNFAFYKSTDGGASYFKAMNGIPTGPNLFDGTTDRTLFITPFTMDPNNSSTIVGGTYRVWRTTNGASNWSAISSDLTGDGSGTNGAKISAVTVAKGNSNVIYVGCTNGRVQVTTNAGSNWNLRNSGLPNAYVTRISTDANNPAVAYVSFSGFLSGNKVFKTTDYGQSWTNASGNLPNIPVNCLLVNPSDANTVFAGTDLGVFTTTNSGNTWTQDNTGMANVPVFDLDYRSSDGKIFAATHGRSMYSSSLSGGSGGTQTAQLIYDDGVPTSGYYWPSNGQGSANRMTPTLSNAQLVSMEIYFTSVVSGTATYKPIVLNNNGGSPGSDIISHSFKVASSVPGWDVTNLSSYNITVNGDFFIGLKYDGVNTPAFGYDPANNNRAWDFNGSSWSAWNETYFMRATIQTTTSVAEISNLIPDKFELTQNFPNPFNPTTQFRYALPEGKNVKIIIYDIRGREVAVLVNNYQAAGTYEVTWNGKNNAGQQVASGTYIYSVQAGDFVQTKKMVLLK